ncbi:UNVERIFIED_CONTAM: hypothetical protein RMT77_019987 [Armadillidium vulgare]
MELYPSLTIILGVIGGILVVFVVIVVVMVVRRPRGNPNRPSLQQDDSSLHILKKEDSHTGRLDNDEKDPDVIPETRGNRIENCDRTVSDVSTIYGELITTDSQPDTRVHIHQDPVNGIQANTRQSQPQSPPGKPTRFAPPAEYQNNNLSSNNVLLQSNRDIANNISNNSIGDNQLQPKQQAIHHQHQHQQQQQHHLQKMQEYQQKRQQQHPSNLHLHQRQTQQHHGQILPSKSIQQPSTTVPYAHIPGAHLSSTHPSTIPPSYTQTLPHPRSSHTRAVSSCHSQNGQSRNHNSATLVRRGSLYMDSSLQPLSTPLAPPPPYNSLENPPDLGAIVPMVAETIRITPNCGTTSGLMSPPDQFAPKSFPSSFGCDKERMESSV